MSNDKVLEITSKFITDLANEKPSNLMMAVKTHYDLWQSELVVLLKERNLPVNEYIAKLLRECGYEKANADKVRSYMSKIGKSKSKAVPVPVAESAITSPVAVRGQGGAVGRPAVGVQGVEAQGGSTGAVPGGTKPVVVSKHAVVPVGVGQVVYDLDEFPFREHSERLQAQVNGFYAGKGMEWTADDDELLAVFSQISFSRFVALNRLASAFSSSETFKQACFGSFKIKCKELGVDLSLHGFR